MANETKLYIETEDGMIIEFPDKHCSLTLYFVHPNGQKSSSQIPFPELARKIFPGIDFNEMKGTENAPSPSTF